MPYFCCSDSLFILFCENVIRFLYMFFFIATKCPKLYKEEYPYSSKSPSLMQRIYFILITSKISSFYLFTFIFQFLYSKFPEELPYFHCVEISLFLCDGNSLLYCIEISFFLSDYTSRGMVSRAAEYRTAE